jgi:4-amino-4-deoxy-L-arabinose transferase-like glycosyltransferase
VTQVEAEQRPGAAPRRARATVWTWAILGAILVVALVLRLWNIDHNLPFVYNADEELHFVPKAVDMFGGSLNPGYFENPPALTYLLYLVFRLRFLGDDLRELFVTDPGPAFETARIVVALIGTLVVGLVYWAGARFYDRRVGLVAAAVMAVAFLPLFYSKHALNDTVTMAPVAVALVGCLLVYERGRWVDWLLAGGAIGVATATKYTAGAMVIVLLVAAALRVARDRSALKPALVGFAVAIGALLLCFAILNPFAILHPGEARSQLSGQSDQASTAKLGQDDTLGWFYYVKTLTWGFGWLPMIAAIAGGVLALVRDWRRGLLLVVFPVVLWLYLGEQGRHFGRWLMPIYPALCILAGYAVVSAAEAIKVRVPVVIAVLAAVLCVQGVVQAVHIDTILGREDTRTQARAWMEANIPDGAKVVVEPFIPGNWLTLDASRTFDRFPVKRPYQAYEKKLKPALIERYRRAGYCWVVVGSHQKDRGLAAGLKNARAYYRALDRASASTTVFSPYRRGADPVAFSYDFSFNYEPRAYTRPGPVVEIHRLSGCR